MGRQQKPIDYKIIFNRLQVVEQVLHFIARFLVERLTDQKSELVSVLTGGRNTDSAGPDEDQTIEIQEQYKLHSQTYQL